MNENNIQIEQQSGIEQQSEAQAKRLLAYYSYLRKSQKMTQSELERITGLSRIAINRCENGKLMPTIRSMNKLLAPLGYQLGIVSLDESDSGDYNEEINERQNEKNELEITYFTELAKEEDMIVMGRAADVVLTGQHIPHISIYITAPFAIRVRRMMELKNLDLKQAINLVRKMDHKHQDYYHSFTGKRWGDAINYDLCINSACYGIDESVELIGRLINRQAKLVHRNKDTK